MDSSNDVEFDAFWEEESRNKTRNRIRVGRQYQASVPPLLKPGESDNRRLEDLETQSYRPSQLSDQDMQEYLSMAKAVSVFSRTLENRSHDNLQSAIGGLTEFVMSHHPCHRDSGCRMSVKTNWTSKETELLASALDRCENANRKKMLEEGEDTGSDDGDGVDDISDAEIESQQPSSATGSADLLVDVNPPSEIKPIPARVIGRKTDSPSDPLSGPNLTATATVALIGNDNNDKNHIDGAEANTSQQQLYLQQQQHLQHQQQLQMQDPTGQGSLKFYMGGQLILKLNANQDKKTWVEAPDNPAGGQSGVAGSTSQNRRKAGRKTHRASTTSTGIAWPERGSPSQDSTSSLDSHNSTTTPTTTATSIPTSLININNNTSSSNNSPSITVNTTTPSPTNAALTTTTTNSCSLACSSSTSSSSSSSSGAQQQQACSGAQQPVPLDLSSQQS